MASPVDGNIDDLVAGLKNISVSNPVTEEQQVENGGERDAGETLDSVQSNETETSSVPNCSKCDGAHESENCPYFNGPSELEKQELANQAARMRREAGEDETETRQPCPCSCRCECLEGCCWNSGMGGGGPGPCFIIAFCPCLVASFCFMACKDMCISTFRALSSDNSNQL